MSTFKVGDWVKGLNGKYMAQIEKIVGTSVFMKGESSYNHINDLHMIVELWIPKEDDYCWFYVNENTMCFSVGTPYFGVFGRKIFGQESFVMKGSSQTFDRCEPFIGRPPKG